MLLVFLNEMIEEIKSHETRTHISIMGILIENIMHRFRIMSSQ